MRVSVGALDVLTVELSLAGSTGGIELVDQPFECFHRHIVLIGAKQELACRIRRIGLDIGLCLVTATIPMATPTRPRRCV